MMRRLTDLGLALLARLDFWLVSRTKDALTLANDWLSIKQRGFEKIAILVHFAATVLSDFPITPIHLTDIIAGTVFTCGFWVCSNLWGAPERVSWSVSYLAMGTRLLYFGSAVVALIAVIGWHTRVDLFLAAHTLSGLAFFYSLAIPPEDGEGGRKRKLSLEKLKAMFGSSWVPVSAPAALVGRQQ